jgi:hypothetical protein
MNDRPQMIAASLDHGREIRDSLVYIALALAAYLLPLVLYHAAPVTYVWLVTEDSLAEWGTVIAWLGVAAGIVVLLAYTPDLRGPGMIAFALVAVALAGEEMSWGQRVFGFVPPDFFQAYSRQGELNLHNLVLNSRFNAIAAAVASWSAIVSPLALVWAPVRRFLTALAVPIVPPYLAPLFVVACLYVTMTAVPDRLTGAATELGEFYLALTALLLVVHMAYVGRRPASRVVPFTVALTVLLFVCIAGDVVSGRLPSQLQLKGRMFQFAVFAYPKDGKDGHAARIFDYMEAHPELVDHGLGHYAVTPGTRIEHARLLLRLGQEEKARDVLAQELAFLDDPSHIHPRESVAAERNRAIALKMLGREAEAATAFAAAVAADEAKLAAAKDAEAEAWARWSLAKTYAAVGNMDAAQKEARRAYERTPLGDLRKAITDWSRNNLPSEL